MTKRVESESSGERLGESLCAHVWEPQSSRTAAVSFLGDFSLGTHPLYSSFACTTLTEQGLQLEQWTEPQMSWAGVPAPPLSPSRVQFLHQENGDSVPIHGVLCGK